MVFVILFGPPSCATNDFTRSLPVTTGREGTGRGSEGRFWVMVAMGDCLIMPRIDPPGDIPPAPPPPPPAPAPPPAAEEEDEEEVEGAVDGRLVGEVRSPEGGRLHRVVRGPPVLAVVKDVAVVVVASSLSSSSSGRGRGSRL